MSIKSVESRQDSQGAVERPRAYSYVRFSTPEQAKGASYERQVEMAQAFARERGLELAATSYTDLGVSAYRHKNAETGALRAFLTAVELGDVPSGSYLLVESLDRLTRHSILEAQSLFGLIIGAGITLVTLADKRSYSRESITASPTDLIISIVLMMRGHEESATKSRRVTDAYDRKRKAAAQRTENRPFTRMLPAWLTWNEDTKEHEAIPDRATVVRRIFQMADSGLGQHAIAQRLNAEGVPTFGGLGNQRKADVWQRSYIKRVLTNSAVVGTFTPHQRRRDTQGKISRTPLDPIDNYFPAVIDRDLFERVASRAQATAPRGRNAAAEPKSVFAGLLRCAHCGSIATRMVKGRNVYLICSRANRRRECRYQAVRYTDVEDALTVNARAIIDDAPRAQDTEEIEAELVSLDIVVSDLSDEARELADELIREKSAAVRARLREKEQQWTAASEQLRQLRARRDTLAAPYVARRLQAVERTLTHKPFSVVEANKALKEAASKIIINPETGTMLIHWHHAPELPTELRFPSRHHHEFDEAPGGYDRPRRAKDGE